MGVSMAHRPWEDTHGQNHHVTLSGAPSAPQAAPGLVSPPSSMLSASQSAAFAPHTLPHRSSSQTLPSISTLTSSIPKTAPSVSESSPPHLLGKVSLDHMNLKETGRGGDGGRERDSGNWSLPQSTRSSIQSSAPPPTYQLSPLHRHDSTSHLSIHSTGSSHAAAATAYAQGSGFPTQTRNRESFASSRTKHSSGLPASVTAATTEGNVTSGIGPGVRTPSIATAESRRSSLSIDSRMHQGMHGLTLSGGSVSFGNASQASLLGLGDDSHTERAQNPSPSHATSAAGLLSHRSSTASAGSYRNLPPASSAGTYNHQSPSNASPMLYSHSASHQANTSERHATYAPPRIAPTIAENPEAEIYNAENPTRGKAYAFPDPLLNNASSGSARSSLHSANGAPGPVRKFGRRLSVTSFGSSGVASVERRSGEAIDSPNGSSHDLERPRRETKAVSIYGEGSLPEGQSELPPFHQHPMQHKQVRSLIGDPPSPSSAAATPLPTVPGLSVTPSGPPSTAASNTSKGTANSTTPYSRTPELRISHKLAERKRRSEMKDCFEMLRARLPFASGTGMSGDMRASTPNRSSKWDTLTRSIEYIDHLEKTVSSARERERIIMQTHKEEMANMSAHMENIMSRMQREMDDLRARLDATVPPNTQLQQGCSPASPHSSTGLPAPTLGQAQRPSANGYKPAHPGRTLPPLIGGIAAGPGMTDRHENGQTLTPMQGLQYG